MKTRKLLSAVLLAASIVTGGYVIYTSQKEVELSDLAKANVEALADGEIEVGPLCYGCAIYAIGICKDWGWGGCKGQSLIHYV